MNEIKNYIQNDEAQMAPAKFVEVVPKLIGQQSYPRVTFTYRNYISKKDTNDEQEDEEKGLQDKLAVMVNEGQIGQIQNESDNSDKKESLKIIQTNNKEMIKKMMKNMIDKLMTKIFDQFN